MHVSQTTHIDKLAASDFATQGAFGPPWRRLHGTAPAITEVMETNERKPVGTSASTASIEAIDARQMLATVPTGFEADLVAGGLYEPTAMDVRPMAASL